MSYVISHSRKLLISLLKSEFNYRLMMLSSRQQLMAMKSADLTKQKAEIQNEQMQQLIKEGAENITLQDVQSIATMTTDIDVQLELLAFEENDMEAEIRMVETQLNALVAEEEQIDKLVDSSAKKEFGIYSSSSGS